MKILLLAHAFNSLAQRTYIELGNLGHDVTVEFDINDATSLQAVELAQPDLIVAPFLKRAIAEEIWQNCTCFIVHPGIIGDRGPSALDWAILNREKSWGVTVLQAIEAMDAGDIWASVEFPMRETTKASLYRNEVTEAAIEALTLAITRYQDDLFTPVPLQAVDAPVHGQLRPLLKQAERSINWQCDNTQTVLDKIRSGDGFPGLVDELFGLPVSLFDAHPETTLTGIPGEVIAYKGPAICRATADGAVWIGHLKDKCSEHPFKLPATQVLEKQLADLPEAHEGYREIWYEEQGPVGYLHFAFYNGAMSTSQCHALRDAYRQACQQDTKVIVLMGGADFWSNGLHLNVIEAAESAADESWENINAINDFAQEIITTQTHLTISALQGNAGAGGVFLARAADRVWARTGVVLNPHYKDMGNLFGSEYWTYLLPKRVGQENAVSITQARQPMGTQQAKKLGLVDDYFATTGDEFITRLKERAVAIADDPWLVQLVEQKCRLRQQDEIEKPLQQYRDEELQRMNLNFYGFDPSYHVARYNFVYKVPKSRTPITLAHHRNVHQKLTPHGSNES